MYFFILVAFCLYTTVITASYEYNDTDVRQIKEYLECIRGHPDTEEFEEKIQLIDNGEEVEDFDGFWYMLRNMKIKWENACEEKRLEMVKKKYSLEKTPGLGWDMVVALQKDSKKKQDEIAKEKSFFKRIEAYDKLIEDLSAEIKKS